MAIILALPPGSGTPSVLARQFSPILPTVCQHRRSPAPALLAAGRWARSGSFGGSFTASVIAPLRMCPPLECAPGSAAATAAPPAMFTLEGFEAFLVNLQSSICDEAAAADGSGKLFGFDKWQRGEGASNGYGITRVLEGGNLLEKAAANVSIVRGHLSEARAKAGNECTGTRR